MKEYENFMEEEARQDRLQEELEDKRMEEAYDAEENWQDYQREQEKERWRDEMMKENPDYDYHDYYDANLGDSWDDDRDFYEDNLDDEDGDCYIHEFVTEDIVLGQRIIKKSAERNQQEERIYRKAIARNQHHAAEKAKRRAKESAKILEARYYRAVNAIDDTDLRLSKRAHAASKKASRVKTA